MSENLKLSEAAKLCGISARTLKLLIADGLLPQAIRTPQGHPLLPDDAIPTWQDCRQLIEQQRDRLLQRAAYLLNRVNVELEAISNDRRSARTPDAATRAGPAHIDQLLPLGPDHHFGSHAAT
ncbi:MerR family transcriptional regulator [Mycobacterium gordonae]|uniref:HTH merR-type domain-containing protein n=1 Tax=Mycobacterium gordonae TaxID=1778 RepID=A0A1X1X170_MYCGO|nr:MerR family DNA-binding transcriptional regulator [Mycobacterium gordonae]MCV7008233.1 MerR family DNA-binding transcriptional regulator [Mycobacterium gordonae]ORV92635.1 hypothetical protein AWC08_19220 [Mycobacterium gordonae]